MQQRIAQPSCAASTAKAASKPSMRLTTSLLLLAHTTTSFIAPTKQTRPPTARSFDVLSGDHTFLEGVGLAIATKIAINEVRRRVEKPVMDEFGRRVASGLKPEPADVTAEGWAKLVGCLLLDLAGDASELIPGLGELTDVVYAPVEAGLLKALFASNAIAAFGFAEELLPFTDIIPTFTLSWCLANLWPTTGLAKQLVPDLAKKNTLLPAGQK